MRVAVVSDAWIPQVNGVVRTLSRLKEELEEAGHEMRVISPDLFNSFPCPTYPDIRLALRPYRLLTRLLDDIRPEAIHIATEGPLGWAARRYCRRRRYPFSTSFHTRFPEYIAARFGIPPSLGYAVLRRFHSSSSSVMVATRSLRGELAARGFRNLRAWSRGVDTTLFRPRPKGFFSLPRPVWLYVGRVAVEKNVGAFLDLDLPGTKVVVGDGPQLRELERRYSDVRFVGPQHGEPLAQHYAAGDVFIFPSRTDTFGLVILEALASGVPVAAYPVPGPIDVIEDGKVGCLDHDLANAAKKALAIPAEACRAYALNFSWRHCAMQFFGNLHPIGNPSPGRPQGLTGNSIANK